MADNEKLWDAFIKANSEASLTDSTWHAARDALVSRLCSCYVPGEDWEQHAVYCSRRLSKTCPFYCEYQRRLPSEA